MLSDSILLKLFQQATQMGGLLKSVYFPPLHGVLQGNINDIELTPLSAKIKIINKNKGLKV
jgi:hypothetical protein